MPLSDDPQTRQATINDVAKLAGTSIATVSRVLNQNGYPVSAETRRRVEEAARALHYTPNLLGSLLKSRSNRFLGIIIPSFQNPYFIQLVMGIEHAAKQRKYSTFVFCSQRDKKRERALLAQSAKLHLSGVFLSSIDDDAKALQNYMTTHGSVAIFEADFPISPQLLDATSQMDENGFLATHHLIELGHRRIALLTTPLHKHNRIMVYEGYRKALLSCNLPFSPDDVFVAPFERELDNGLFEFEAGKELGKSLLSAQRSYTGIVAVNDLVACGIVQQLTRSGVRVPEDISVIGIDDIPQCVMITPTLSSINQQSYNHGYSTCMRLIDRLESEQVTLNERCYCQPQVIKRESTKAISENKE